MRIMNRVAFFHLFLKSKFIPTLATYPCLSPASLPSRRPVPKPLHKSNTFSSMSTSSSSSSSSSATPTPIPTTSDARVVLCTAPSQDVSKSIAKHILEKKLAACVNIVPQITSMYWWDNAIQEDTEYLLVIKTLQSTFDELKTEIVKVHPYDVPEVISLNVDDGHDKYLNWIKDSVKSK